MAHRETLCADSQYWFISLLHVLERRDMLEMANTGRPSLDTIEILDLARQSPDDQCAYVSRHVPRNVSIHH